MRSVAAPDLAAAMAAGEPADPEPTTITSYVPLDGTGITSDEAAHARVLAGVVTGVGFLGAGVIFRGAGKVSGITTATLIWALAAIGCTIGFGFPWIAISATIFIMIVLGLVDVAEHLFPRLRREQDVAALGSKEGDEG